MKLKPIGKASPNQKFGHGSIVTQKQAEDLAKRSGYVCLDIKKLAAAAQLGQYAEDTIIGPFPSLILIDAAEKIRRSIEECDRIISNPGVSPEMKHAAICTMSELVSQQMAVAKQMTHTKAIRSATSPPVAPPAKSFSAGEKVIPTTAVQVNIGISDEKSLNTNGNGL